MNVGEVETYKEWIELDNCESDVKRFIDKVCANFETFSLEFVTELYNEKATKELIEFTIKTKINGIIGFMVRRTFGELLKFPER